MPNRFRIPSALSTRLKMLGMDPAAVLATAALPADLLARAPILVTTAELFAFWQAIGELAPSPTTALEIGSEPKVERYDPILLAAISGGSLREAFARMGRYKRLAGPEALVVTPAGRETRVSFEWLAAERPAPAALVDVCLSTMATLARRGGGGAIRPLRVDLRRAPCGRAAFERHFGCPVRFQARTDALAFATADLDRPWDEPNRDLLEILLPRLNAGLARQEAEQSTSDVALEVLRRGMRGARPDLARVAAELGLSSRTLQRRLIAEGVSFKELLDQARRDLARDLLQHSPTGLAEIAFVLGYSDAQTFHRAFRRWEGVTPAMWRRERVVGRN